MSNAKTNPSESFFSRLQHVHKPMNGAEFCRAIGISTPLYQKWKSGSIPGYDKLRLISEKFGVSVDWLLTGNESVKTTLTYTIRERLYEAKGATGLSLPQLADRMGVAAKEVERIMNEGGNPNGLFLSAFEQHLQPEIDRIKSTPCAGCRSKESEIAFLRSQLSESLARIPKPTNS
ncbi:MAG TPA: hypothetical protein DCY07_00300 [Rhodospirillaceae bacterium]|nr:hypothetical protein [Rhodospirillaceae bacterium]